MDQPIGFPALTRRFLVSGAAIAGAAAGLPGGRALAAQTMLTVALQGLPDSLDTGVSSFAALNLAYQTLDPLVLRDDRGQLLPGLAERWTAVDSKTWKFELRRGVAFHDGRPFSAQDVKFTLDYILDPKSVYGSKSRISQIEGCEPLDDHTLLVTTKGPFPTLINGLSDIAIEPRHYVEKVGRAGMIARPIGTGPFEFEKWLPGDRYELKSNAKYWGGTPRIERLVLRQIPEGSTRVASLLAGEAQIVEELPIDLIAAVQNSRNAAVASVESTVGLILTFDTRKPPFNDRRVRLALNLAIDKQKILDRMLLGQGSVLQGQILTSNTFGFNPALKAYPYDPKRAKALLAEAGYPDGFQTSLTTRAGKYLGDVEICNVCAAMFAEIGVKTAVNVVEQGVFSKMVTARDMGPIHMVGWYSLGDADFAAVWFTEATGRAFWKSDEYERLFVEARSTVDQPAREKAYHRMMEIMHEDAPAICLFGLPSVYGRSKALKDWQPPSDKILRLRAANAA